MRGMNVKLALSGAFLASLCGATLLGASGCSDDEKPSDTNSTGGSAGAGGSDGEGDAGGSGGADSGIGEPDCVENPTTHLEIINACTDAEKIDKQSMPPLLLPDGELPPLP